MGLTVKRLSKVTGIQAHTLHLMESLRHRGGGAAAEKLARFFNVTVSDLFPDAVVGMVRRHGRKANLPMTARQIVMLQASLPSTLPSSHDAVETKDRVRRLLDGAGLTDRQRHVIDARFGLSSGDDGRSLKEVGQGMGVSQESVRQIEAAALRKLRQVRLGGPARPGWERVHLFKWDGWRNAKLNVTVWRLDVVDEAWAWGHPAERGHGPFDSPHAAMLDAERAAAGHAPKP